MTGGELSSGASNKRAAYIVDNQLAGVGRLIGNNGIIAEGSYTASFVSGASQIVLVGTPTNYALEAYINEIYIAQNNALIWSALPNASTIYLYVQLIESNLYTSTEQSSLAGKIGSPIWNTNGLTPTGSILIGIVVTTTSSITLNTSSTISDSTYVQRPVLQPYGTHRTANPIDHPFHSIFNAHLTDNCIRSNNLQPWDGTTSGVGVFSLLSGTGIATVHIKPKAVTSEKLDSSLSVSGLQVQQNLTTLQGGQATFSGLAQYPGFTGQLPTEAVPLQYLQNNLSGVQQQLTGRVTSLTSSLSGVQQQLSNSLTATNASVTTNTAAIATNIASIILINQSMQASSIAVTSGVTSIQVLYPTPFPIEPIVTTTIHRLLSSAARITLQDITSGSSGGFVGNFVGGSPDTGTHALHWIARIPTS